MPRKKTTPHASLTFKKFEPVIVVSSPYSSCPVQLVGFVVEEMPDGSAVYFRRTVHIALFGGGGYRKEATMFMSNTCIGKFKPSERQTAMLKAMLDLPDHKLSLTRANDMFTGRPEPLKDIKLEYELDDLWDAGLAYCRGEFDLDENGKWQYALTQHGIEYARQLT